MRSKVAWYTPQVLPYSQTFVANQLEAMPGVETNLFGINRVPGNEVRGTAWVLDDDAALGRLQAMIFKASRWSPSLHAALRAFSPDLLIAHFLQGARRIAPTAEHLGVPLVAMCHGADVLTLHGGGRGQSLGMRQLAADWPRFVEGVRLFLVVSEFLAQRLVEAGVAPSRMTVHYLGVPIPQGADLGSAAERRGVLFVGRLIERKGCDYLLQAVQEIARGRRVDVTVVGDGPERSALLKQAAALPTGAKVRFLGSQPEERVFRLMKEHRVLCVPSVDVASGDSEALGLVACEAAAHGRPVVAFDSGGLREVVVHGATGFVVRQRDTRGLAEALEAVLADDRLADAMGRAARQLAVEKFDLNRQGHQLRELLSTQGLLPAAERELQTR